MKRLSAILPAALFAAACATVGNVSLMLHPEPKQGDACLPHPRFASFGVKAVAVAPFSDSVERKKDQYVIHPKFNANPNTRDIYRYIDKDGEVAASAMENALIQTYRFRVVERRELDKILKEQRLQLTGLVDPREAVELGKLAGADAVLMGEVVGAFAHYVHKTEAGGNFIGTYVPDAILKMRLVHVETGEIVWNCHISRNGMNYLREPFEVSSALLYRSVNFTDVPLLGATPEERIKNILIAAATDAVAYLGGEKPDAPGAPPRP